MLWKVVRNRKLDGKKFLRQYPVVFTWKGQNKFFVADFYCHEAGLIVELDGGIHDKRKKYDQARDYALKTMGFRVMRIKNVEVIGDIEEVVRRLKGALNLPLNSPQISSSQTSAQSPSLKNRGDNQYLLGHSPSLSPSISLGASKRGGQRG